MRRAEEPPVGRLLHEGSEGCGQRREVVVLDGARRVGELDGDGVAGAAGGREAVQLLDGALRLLAAVEPHEPNALRYP